MKTDFLRRAIGEIDDQLIENAYQSRKMFSAVKNNTGKRSSKKDQDQEKNLRTHQLLDSIGNIDYTLVEKAEKQARRDEERSAVSLSDRLRSRRAGRRRRISG